MQFINVQFVIIMVIKEGMHRNNEQKVYGEQLGSKARIEEKNSLKMNVIKVEKRFFYDSFSLFRKKGYLCVEISNFRDWQEINLKAID